MADAAMIRSTAPDGTGFIRAGSGAPVLLIHGVGMDASIWQPQIASMQDRFDLIAIDMLGHGVSPLPPENAGLSDFAEQAIRLLDRLGLKRVAVIGHSMGALVAQEIALRSPSRVSSLVCLNAVFRRPPELAQAVRDRAAALGGPGDPSAIAATIARWFGNPVPPALEDAAATARAALESVDAEGYARTYRLFACADTAHADHLAALAAPALFMTGSEDRNSTPAMSAAMARLAPAGQCLVLNGEKHMMTIASPAKVTQHITAFLDQVADVSTSVDVGPVFDVVEFRRALGSFLTGVTIVTTIDEAGDPRGFTANSFTSVSLEPPLVLVCIAKKALGHQAFSTSRGFAVNILSEAQKSASGIFASKAADKFASVVWQPGQTGNPLIDGSVAVFDCGMEKLVDAGDHSILIGRVQAFTHSGAQPLGYCRGAYVAPGLSQEALAAAPPGTEVGAILESEGRVLFFETADGSYQLPSGLGLGTASDARSLKGRLAAKAIDAELGFLFAVWDDAKDAARTHVYYRGTVQAPLPDDGQLRLVDIERLADLKIADPAVRSMLARYARERTEDQFGVYIGNEVEGEVRPLAKPALSATIHTSHG
ncbi:MULTISPECIES: alpha/beta fold hydrolase [unclassified Mesorhizobium]|uniref:alpha/beta fold hydrolase n=1 Tax=unclassified Mesorhizobium TaxID=325217 RepID=UPI000BB025BA|nr:MULTISPECIES: alpha/beta fold hydrolase [unclassified Mesorhizobium]TGT58639.1 alpha/beta fold hydrolase [Mesorhizobium sp. M00.F.Ca.ET.170.01.1.1]AZO12107.1 alpha/beta fold hydrolase [Mesorhizobium sp. M3A.F.Ca.ET.080.04.2.1]PBB84395.1 flavin reductase [Mesorhizobium sp. WSM3876]RWB74821.1 MAG: alpha/beta fold hydrolase [Mesorhizobium sp.]RWB89719.1 MAG: alpha/beta fold hydrolase [Mesorhizobium sp.]